MQYHRPGNSERNKLEQFVLDIVSCDMAVGRTEAKHDKGNRFLVYTLITLPGAGRT